MTDSSTNLTLADALQKLAGCELSAVTFVRDYVQLAFDGPGMNAYTMPTIKWKSESLSLGQPGYCDSLCDEIGRRVDRTEVDDQEVSIVFGSGTTVAISLRDGDYRGPEALEFWLDREDHVWVV